MMALEHVTYLHRRGNGLVEAYGHRLNFGRNASLEPLVFSVASAGDGTYTLIPRWLSDTQELMYAYELLLLHRALRD